MYAAADLRKGLKVEIEGEPYVVVDFDFCKPGKGQALYRCKMKSMITGSTLDRTFRSADSIDRPNLEEREMTYSYDDGGQAFIFSDSESYEEVRVPPEIVGDMKYFLDDNMACKILFHSEKPIELTLPCFVEKQVMDCEPGVRGDTATNVTKPAKIANGYEIRVPLFVNLGDIVRIDTRTGTYVERVKKGSF
jgi:elongation factor P